MGLAIETVLAQLSSAGVTTEQLLAAASPQSLAIRASNGQAPVVLDNVWASTASLAQLSIRSPRLHDNTKGILLDSPGTGPIMLADEYFDQTVYSQDTLTVGLTFPVSPGAGINEQVAFNVVYNDLPGVAANLRTWQEVQPNIIEYVGVLTTPSSAAATGIWGAGVAFNSGFDLLKANQLYAVIGYITPSACTAVALQGPDIGNLLLGGPGLTSAIDTRQWFVRQAIMGNQAYIPVINSANKASTNAFVASTTAATAYPITWICAHLSA